MKFTPVFLILAISVLGITISAEQAFAQQDNACKPHTICASPGDMLQYSITLRNINSSQTYIFGDMINASNIKVIVDKNTTSILNLETGFVHSEQDTSNVKPFLEVLASPVEYNKSDTAITPLITEFNGFKRTSIAAFYSSENSTSKIVYDIQTGILLEEHSSQIVTIRGNPVIVDFSDKLSSTNMINSDSDGIKNNNVSIPKWVKTIAKGWAHGGLQDSEFTNAIQNLISKGIIQVPHGAPVASSTQKIPTWLKNSTGTWADGSSEITDDTFVQSIQWLISKGIVQVGN